MKILAFTLLPVAATIAGGVAAAFRPPGPRVRGYFQHFAAGVVFCVVAAELLPDVMRRHQPAEIIVGFSLGVAAMLALRRWNQRFGRGAPGGTDQTAGLVATVALDLLIDGLLIGTGFAIGAEEGLLLTLALTVELLSLGLAVSATLGKAGLPRRRAIATTSTLALAVPLGAALGATVLSHLPDRALEAVLSFGLAALLYLVTEELLVEAHEEPETPLATALFFAGFLLFLVLASISTRQ